MFLPEHDWVLKVLRSQGPKERPLTRVWNDAWYYTFPDGTDIVVSWAPPKGKVYIITALTMGSLKDLAGVEVTTTSFGFWYSSGQMKLHFNPGLPAIYNHEFENWLEVTYDDPILLRYINNYGATLLMNANLCILETTEDDYKEIKRFLKGIWNYYSALGSLSIEEIAGRFMK